MSRESGNFNERTSATLSNVAKQVSRILAESGDQQRSLKQVAILVRELCRVSSAVIWAVDKRYRELHVLHGDSLDERETSNLWLAVNDNDRSGVAGRVAFTGKSIVYSDYEPERYPEQQRTPYRRLKGDKTVRMIAAFPLVSRGEVVGVFELLHERPKKLPKAAVEYLDNVAKQWGDTVENHQRYVRQSNFHSLTASFQTIREKCILDSEQRGLQVPEIELFTRLTGELIQKQCGANCCIILEFQHESNTAQFMAVSADFPLHIPSGNRVGIENGGILELLFDDQSIRLWDVFDIQERTRRGILNLECLDSIFRQVRQHHKHLPFLGIPLVSRTRASYGCVLLLGRNPRSRYDEEDANLLSEFGTTLADFVLEWRFAARAFELTNAIQGLAPSADLESSLNPVLQAIRVTLDAQWVYVMELRYQQPERVLGCLAINGRPRGDVPELVVPKTVDETSIGVGINVHVVLSGKPYLASNTSSDKLYAGFRQSPQAGSEFCMPLIVSGARLEERVIVGTICASYSKARAFGYHQVSLMWLAATELAYAINANRLYHGIADIEHREIQVRFNESAFDLAALYIHDIDSHLRKSDKLLNEVIQARTLSDQLRDSLKSHRTSIESEIDSIRRVRDLIKAGGLPRRRSIPVKAILKDVEHAVSGLFDDGKRVHIVKHNLVDYSIYVDYQHARMIFLNVLKNAWQVSLDGDKIYIDSAIEGGFVVVKVRDEGRGFPDRVIEEGVSEMVQSRKGGSGVGLWLSQNLARLYGGNIKLSNYTKGKKGAVVAISLPAASN